MRQQRFIATLVFLTLVATASLIIAATQTPLNATFTDPTYDGVPQLTGVFGDGSDYDNGVGQVQCFLGKNQTNAVLFTYNSVPVRTLTLTFSDEDSAVWKPSGLKQTFPTTVDFYLPSNSISYTKINVGTAIQVRAHLDFMISPYTFRLAYPSLAAVRITTNQWLISSDFLDRPSTSGFRPSGQAELKRYRGGSSLDYGAVVMPVRFFLTLQ